VVRPGEDRGLRLSPVLVCAAILACFASPARAATFVVTNANDGGAGSLREAIAGAEATSEEDLIRIEATGRISLRSPLESLDGRVSIVGPGLDRLEVTRASDAPDDFRILTVSAGASVSIEGVTVSGGLVTDRTAAQGGGIRNAGRLALRRVAIARNAVDVDVVSGAGGGIYNAGVLTIEESTVVANAVTAPAGLAQGGGIYNVSALTVTDSTFTENRLVSGVGAAGAAIGNSGGSATIRRSAIADNRGPGEMTAIRNEAGTLTLENSTVAGNDGGVGVRHPGTTRILSSTIASGSASNLVGFESDVEAFVYLQNTILADPGPGRPNCSIATMTTVVSEGHNLADDGSCEFLGAAGDQAGVDPGVGPLRDNGGPTATMALGAASPAIDRGDARGLTTDQRGLPRPAGAAADVGAFEVQPAPPPGGGGPDPPGTLPPGDGGGSEPSGGRPPAGVPSAPPGPVRLGPASVFRIGAPRRRKRDGTAVVPVTVPGPGTLVLAGRRVRRTTRTVRARGTVLLTARAVRRPKPGRAVTVKTRITFTPRGGVPRTRSLSVRLVRVRPGRV
jgi:hypothetical protein